MAVTRHFRGFLQLLGYRLDIARNLHELWGDRGSISGQSFFVREKELCKVTDIRRHLIVLPCLRVCSRVSKQL